MNTKGIILAGGRGTRLYPLTSVVSKQLQPIYDKPMIYYPLSTLMLAGIRDILIISTSDDIPMFQKLLGDGSQWGIEIKYAIQNEPKGIAEAFIIGEHFIQNAEQVCLILGDNLFHGKLDFLRDAIKYNKGGTVFGYKVSDPERYGVVEFDSSGKVISIEEKPKKPKSKYAIPGLYIFDSNVTAIAKMVQASDRGELEITSVQTAYLDQDRLRVELIGRGIAWLDTGTPESLLEASQFIHAIEKRQNMKVACLEEVALEMGFISLSDFEHTINGLPNSLYKEYCKKILSER
jgi:glucose-1-phosphate thymidylyltransferase